MRVFTIRGLAWAFLARSSSWSCLWWLGGVNVEGGFDVTLRATNHDGLKAIFLSAARAAGQEESLRVR